MIQYVCLVNDRQRVSPNSRITEYSALYRHRIFGVGRIVGLYLIFGIFFTEYLIFLPKTEYLNFCMEKNSFPDAGTNKKYGF
jgi:ABC-type multidrug transport system permease subunit